MYLYNKGIIDKSTTGGLDLSWENAEEIVPLLIEQMAHREGFGALLSDGIRPAIERFGEESRYHLMHIKGLAALTDDRATPALALGTGVATRGCDHLRRQAVPFYSLRPYLPGTENSRNHDPPAGCGQRVQTGSAL